MFVIDLFVDVEKEFKCGLEFGNIEVCVCFCLEVIFEVDCGLLIVDLFVVVFV